jgi:uncharacterized zinc-type alcohol dehydrogenase-like protein
VRIRGSCQDIRVSPHFCGKHKIVSDIDVIPIQKLNEAYERVIKSGVRYRFVIDMVSLKAS